jgi:hypothetical protein
VTRVLRWLTVQCRIRVRQLSLVVAVAASLACALSAAAEGATQLAPIAYTAVDGHTETLTPWQGNSVTVLVEPGTRDPIVMDKLVGALDAAWAYYAMTTGRTPASDRFMLNGRDEVAEVSSLNPPNSCGGAACSYLGAMGTEILTSYFENGYQQIAQNDLYDQALFYELGRSFWFWGPQLSFQSPDQDPVVTGFAVLMRFQSMDAANVNGAPFNGTPFSTFKSQVTALSGQYEADQSLTFADTLAQDKSPGMYGGTDFWASLMIQLMQRHGGQQFLTRFLSAVDHLPTASSTVGAVANWEQAASSAACTDLSSVFYVRWGFPRPDGSVTARPPASAVPEPPNGVCSPPPQCPLGQAGAPPNCVVTPTGGSGSAGVGLPSVAGASVSELVTCAGTGTQTCTVTGTLSATETRRGSKVTAVGAKAKHKTTKRTVTLGSATVTIAAGESAALQMTLSKLGMRLLSKRKTLTVTLTTTQTEGSGAPVVITRRVVTFKRRGRSVRRTASAPYRIER